MSNKFNFNFNMFIIFQLPLSSTHNLAYKVDVCTFITYHYDFAITYFMLEGVTHTASFKTLLIVHTY